MVNTSDRSLLDAKTSTGQNTALHLAASNEKAPSPIRSEINALMYDFIQKYVAYFNSFRYLNAVSPMLLDAMPYVTGYDCYSTNVRLKYENELNNNKVDVLHVRLTDLHAAHQNLPFPPNRNLPLKQYQYQGRL